MIVPVVILKTSALFCISQFVLYAEVLNQMCAIANPVCCIFTGTAKQPCVRYSIYMYGTISAVSYTFINAENVTTQP